ncbi:hypothetical protein F5Y01DRAFT_313015 [Xylaria sp. FL0043]|nr:hypothetical protein F5Y01DRAFT_313015 [Xylaria sp. FL0043]
MAPALPWPFNQRPITISCFDDHRIRLSVAGPADLGAIASFCRDYSWSVKQFVCPEIIAAPAQLKAQMRARYKASIGAILDCCVPGSMTGIVFKIEFEDQIRGVMAINVVSSDFEDPWSQNEREEATKEETAWIFPSDYMGKLAETLGEEDNNSEPILNIPYFVVSTEQPFLSVCIPSFRRLLEAIATLYNRTAVMNLQTGPYEHAFTPYLAGSSFNHTGRMEESPSDVLQPYSAYSNYTFWTDTSRDTPSPYLDRVIRRALADF